MARTGRPTYESMGIDSKAYKGILKTSLKRFIDEATIKGLDLKMPDAQRKIHVYYRNVLMKLDEICKNRHYY